MGFSIVWVAIQSANQNAILEGIPASSTGEADESFESELADVLLMGGWYLLVAQGCDNSLIAPSSLEKLSRIAPLIACSVEEHVMSSSSEFSRAGARVWRVAHDAEAGLLDLETDGQVPDSFATVKANAILAQEREGGAEAEVDFVFEVPLLLAKQQTGFKHDETYDCFAGSSPARLVRDGSSAKPWWKFWWREDPAAAAPPRPASCRRAACAALCRPLYSRRTHEARIHH